MQGLKRRVVYITGGTFAGPRLRGAVLGGADWQIRRRDGAIELDARYALKDERERARAYAPGVVSLNLPYDINRSKRR